MMLLGWILLAATFYYGFLERKSTKSEPMKAKDILENRFRNGKIDVETYQKMSNVLEDI
jgi:uncharacterized membrane protein